MRKAILAILAGLVLCGQSPITAFPPGMFQNRAALDAGAAGSPMVSVILTDVATAAPSNSATSQMGLTGGVITTTVNSCSEYAYNCLQ